MPEVFQYAELWDKLEADGGVRLGFLGVPVQARRRRILKGDHRFTVAVLRTQRHAPSLLRRRVIREVVSADGATLREWIIERIVRGTGDDVLVVVECVAPLQLLLNYPITSVDADGFVYSETGAVQLAPASVVTGLIRSNTPAWIGTGTITPTALVDVGYRGDSALAGVRRLEEATGYEADLRRNGASQYLLDLITIGGSAAPLYVRPGKNLRALQRAEEPDRVTRVNTIQGATGDDGPSGIAWAYWRAGAPSGSQVPLTALHGGAGPIGWDNQGVDLSVANLVPMDWGAWTLNGSMSPVTRHNLVVGEYVLDRLADNTSGTVQYASRAVAFTGDGVKAVSIVVEQDTAATSSLTVRDLTAAVNRLEVTLGWSAGAPAITMVAGTLLGTDNLGGGLYRLRCQTTSVTAANSHEARLYPAGQTASNVGGLNAYYLLVENATTPSALPAHLWLERKDGTRTEVTASSASAQEVTVGSITAIASGDLVRFTATRAGKHLTALEDPTAVALYGVVGGRVESAWDDALNVLPNPVQDDWPVPTSRPTSWAGTAGTVSQKTGNGDWLTAGQALQITGAAVEGTLLTSLTRSWYVSQRRHIFYALGWIRLTAGGEVALQVRVGGTVIGSPLKYASPLGPWRQLRIEGIDLAAYIGTTQTIAVELVKGGGSGSFTVIVDSLAAGPGITAKAVTKGSNAARIWQQVNAFLADQSLAATAAHQLSVLDLARLGVAGQPDVVLGQTVYLRPEDTQIADTTARIVELNEDPLAPEATQVVLAARVPRASAQQVAPVPLVIPYLDSVAVQRADRDTRVTPILVKASVTATTTTQVTVELAVTDPLGATPAVAYAVFGATYVSGSGVGPYVFNRPNYGSGTGRVVFTATLPGRPDGIDAVDVPEQEASEGLVCRTSLVSTTATQVVVRVAVADPHPPGGASVTVAYASGGLTVTPASGGTLTPTADLATTGTIDYTITRPNFGAGTGRVTFTASASGKAASTDGVDVPAKERDTIALSCRATLQTINTTTVVIRVAVADPVPPGGASVTVNWTVSGGTVTPASGGTLTPTADLATTGTIDYTVDRPGANSPARRFTVTATDAPNGRVPASDSVDVPAQDPPTLQLQGQETSTTQWTFTWTATGTVEVSKNGGAYGTPAAAGLTSGTAFNRPVYGAADDVYSFRVTNGGVTMSAVGNVPATKVLTGHSLSISTPFGVDATPGPTRLDITWSTSGMPSGTTYDVAWKLFTAGVATGAEGFGVDVTSTYQVTPSPAFTDGDKVEVVIYAKHQGKVILTKSRFVTALF